jgi:uncharacterized protein (TIGR03067 family)
MSPLSLIVVSSLIAAPLKEDPLPPALKDLQGHWQAVSVEEKGRQVNKKQVQTVTIEIKGEILVYKEGDDVEKFRIKLVEPEKKPAKMDLTLIADGVDSSKACHIIYEISKDSLKFCLPSQFTASSPDERPTEFITGGERPPQGKLLFVLEQVK